MSEMKANQRERVRIEVSAIRKYFPRSCTARQMEESIVKMLEAQYRRSSGARNGNAHLICSTPPDMDGVLSFLSISKYLCKFRSRAALCTEF